MGGRGAAPTCFPAAAAHALVADDKANLVVIRGGDRDVEECTQPGTVLAGVGAHGRLRHRTQTSHATRLQDGAWNNG